MSLLGNTSYAAVNTADAKPSESYQALIYPAFEPSFTQSLNGDWHFKYRPSLEVGEDAGFYQPAADVSMWKTIKVPSTWEVVGVAEPRYGLALEDAMGLYRRSFTVPKGWKKNRRVCLRFEGVGFGFEVWVNGQNIGHSVASAFNPHTFDITEAVQAGENMLAVKVITKPHGYKFDLSDEWSLSGIFRDVTLFSIPSIHVQDLETSTKLAQDGSAVLSVKLTVNNAKVTVKGQLLAPSGASVQAFTFSQAGNNTVYESVVKVPNPALWTAETPSLYSLKLELVSKGKTIQTIERRIGLREITVDGFVLLLNGRPIKLRGVARHDLDPRTGRTLTSEQLRADLEWMKKGNINFIRTSHYPPTERFIALCDEMGFYVMDEVPMASRGGAYLEDPDYKENILNRVVATVTRDKNHPSVIAWSIGNENEMNEGEIMAIHRLKEIDATRPVILPKTAGTFGSNRSKYPDCVDLYSAHYPYTDNMVSWSTRLSRPIIFTEYAHAQGLATERVASQWNLIQRTPRFAGGSIWHFQDQGLLRVSQQPINPDTKTVYVWLDKDRYYDTGQKVSSNVKGLDGADGIVYADRTPQSDFWEVRKVYAPIQILERFAPVTIGQQTITATIENRYDFRSLSGIKLNWSLCQNGLPLQEGVVDLRAKSHEKETVEIPVLIPSSTIDDVLTLQMSCVDEAGLAITERALRLDPTSRNPGQWLSQLPALGELDVTEKEGVVTVGLADFYLRVVRETGAVSIEDREGRTLVAGIYPHVGRKKLMVEGTNAGSRFGYWPISNLTEVDSVEVRITKE